MMCIYKCECHTDETESAAVSAESFGRVSRPIRKNSTAVMPMCGINENKTTFWKLLLSSEKAVTQSQVMYCMFVAKQ